MFSIGFEHETDYDGITDGKWGSDAEYGTIHRAAVAKEFRGTGLSAYIIKNAVDICEKNNIRYLRSDTHKKNKAMQWWVMSFIIR